ncbi:MAG TPA: hypothetical protein PK208_10175 [Fibrobacteria bacterium]|nr:hypothetical protein [Fibrobacteria bacterium]
MDYSGDRFIDKNNSLAKAYETDRLKGRTVVKKDLGGAAKEEAQTCYNCKTRNRCDTFRKWRTGGTAGVVSVGQDQQYWCAKWIEDPVTKVNAVSDKQAKSMMRSFKSGRL